MKYFSVIGLFCFSWLLFGQVDLDNGLVVHYPFNGNALDASGNGIHGQLIGASPTNDRFGNSSGALSFNGLNNFIDIGSIGTGLQSYSVSFWLRTPNLENGFVLFSNWANGNDINIYFEKTTNQIVFLHRDNDNGNNVNGNKEGGDAVFAHQWSNYDGTVYHHVVFVRNVAENVQVLYLDGALVDSLSPLSQQEITRDEGYEIGRSPVNAAYLPGQLDEFRIYNRPLNNEEIHELYGQYHPVPQSGLIAHYEFEGDGMDSSPYGNHGTLRGGISFIEGVQGQAAHFDGIDDFIDIGSFGEPSYDTYSISLWIQAFSHNTKNVTVFGNYGAATGANHNMITMGIYSQQIVQPLTGRIMFIQRDSDRYNGGNYEGGDYLESPDQWDTYHLGDFVHVVIVRDSNSGTQSMFLNGLRVDHLTQLTQNPMTKDAEFVIGKGAWYNIFFEGNVDEFRFYNRALNEAEIQALYNIEPPNQAPIANAGDDQAIHVGGSVILDGSQSYDPDEHYPLSYQWEWVSKPIGSLTTISDVSAESPFIIADLEGDYVLRLVVSDSEGLSSDFDEVLVSSINTPPVANAGPDQGISLVGEIVPLDGSQSWDDDGDTLSYSWSFLSRPSGSQAVLENADTKSPTFVADVNGDYEIQLIVSDPWASSTPDNVFISFDNVPPVANAGMDQIIVVGESVSFDGSDSYDDNGDTLTYSWSILTAPDGSVATITNFTTVISNLTPDLAGNYTISLTVNDGRVDCGAPAIVHVLVRTQQDQIGVIGNEILNLFDPDNPIITLDDLHPSNASSKIVQKVNQALDKLDNGKYEEALSSLEFIIRKTDGCYETGAPDPNDWVTNCESQDHLYPLVAGAIELTLQLLNP